MRIALFLDSSLVVIGFAGRFYVTLFPTFVATIFFEAAGLGCMVGIERASAPRT